MLAEALRLIRVFHDMKQQEMADRLALSKSYVSELENGKKVPSMEVIQRYSDAFGIPVSSILLFSEGLENSSNANRTKSAIAERAILFLKLIEAKTTDAQA